MKKYFTSKFSKDGKTAFWSGFLGGLVICTVFIGFLFMGNLFNYRVTIESVHIKSPSGADSLNVIDDSNLKKLIDNKVVLSPQEYTNNVVNYYNVLITVLIGMMLIFSIVSYIQLKYISDKRIVEVMSENIRDSKDFEKMLTESIFGKAEPKFVSQEDFQLLMEKTDKLANYLHELADNSKPAMDVVEE